MNAKQLFAERFSVRKYNDKAIDKEIITQLMEMVRLAPSAVNYQPLHFIVIQDKSRLAELTKTYPREWFSKAPSVIVACVNHHQSWKRPNDHKDFGDVDVAIAIDHLTLAAVELGLGTCWVCNFDAKMCSEILKLPTHIEPLALIPIGYPAENAPEKKRKPTEEFVSWESYFGE